MDKNFSIQPREPLLEKQFPRPLGDKNASIRATPNITNKIASSNQSLFVGVYHDYFILLYLCAAVVKGGCDNGWSEDQFERDCEPVDEIFLITIMMIIGEVHKEHKSQKMKF